MSVEGGPWRARGPLLESAGSGARGGPGGSRETWGWPRLREISRRARRAFLWQVPWVVFTHSPEEVWFGVFFSLMFLCPFRVVFLFGVCLVCVYVDTAPVTPIKKTRKHVRHDFAAHLRWMHYSFATCKSPWCLRKVFCVCSWNQPTAVRAHLSLVVK